MGFFILRSIVFLPIGIIEAANEDGWLRSLSYFVKCKSLYHNNTFYNFSLRRLSERLKCSPEALRVHLKTLNEKGLVSYNHGNLTFKGAEKLKEICDGRSKKLVNVKVEKDQLTVLRGKIVQLNLNRQCYRIRKAETIIRQSKRVKSSFRKAAHSVSLSNKGFGKLFSLSPATGKVIKKKLVALNQIKAERCIKVLFRNCPYYYFRNLLKTNTIPAYSKYNNGLVFVDAASLIEYVDSYRPTEYLLGGLIRSN